MTLNEWTFGLTAVCFQMQTYPFSIKKLASIEKKLYLCLGKKLKFLNDENSYSH